MIPSPLYCEIWPFGFWVCFCWRLPIDLFIDFIFSLWGWFFPLLYFCSFSFYGFLGYLLMCHFSISLFFLSMGTLPFLAYIHLVFCLFPFSFFQVFLFWLYSLIGQIFFLWIPNYSIRILGYNFWNYLFLFPPHFLSAFSIGSFLLCPFLTL